MFPIVGFQLAHGQGEHSLLAENGVVGLTEPGFHDVRQEVTGPGVDQTVSKIHVGSADKEVFKF